MAQQKDVIYRPLDGGSFDTPSPTIGAPVSPLSPQQQKSALTARLQRATAELRELEELVRSGNLDPRVLSEFRGAVDYIRTTTWAVQQWVGLEQQSGDPYTVLPILSAERVRRATQLARDLSLDLQSVEVTFETPGLKQLYEAIEDLYRRLAVLFKGTQQT
ncbi:MAG TPA: hypothetical protein VJR23_00590 [Candidatus Acidoferrales bacterium]|nr:hypothetical protein [Candidatus Acidoferrales bacterium]